MKSANADLKSAKSDLTSAQNGRHQGRRRTRRTRGSRIHRRTAKASDAKETDLRDSIVGTQYAISITILVLGLLYLVPSTARTGRTFGMRNRRLKVVRVDRVAGGLVARVRALLHPAGASPSCC